MQKESICIRGQILELSCYSRHWRKQKRTCEVEGIFGCFICDAVVLQSSALSLGSLASRQANADESTASETLASLPQDLAVFVHSA